MPSKKPTSKTMYVIQRKSDGLFYKRASETDRFREDNTWTDSLLEAHLFKSTGHAKQSGAWANTKLILTPVECTCKNRLSRKEYARESTNRKCGQTDYDPFCASMIWVKITDEKDFPHIILPVKVKVELGKVK